jgi:hypothetical protein
MGCCFSESSSMRCMNLQSTAKPPGPWIRSEQRWSACQPLLYSFPLSLINNSTLAIHRFIFTIIIRPLDPRCKKTANESRTFPSSQPPVPCRSSRPRTLFSTFGTAMISPSRNGAALVYPSFSSFSLVFMVTDIFLSFFFHFAYIRCSVNMCTGLCSHRRRRSVATTLYLSHPHSSRVGII